MQLAMIGLGRMGANMTARLLRGGHQVVVYDVNPEACKAAEALGATTVGGLDELVSALTPPRVAWMMVPVGDPVETTVGILASEFSEGDIVIDGGNSHYKDSMRRAGLLAERSQHFIDVGTSGGVWGLAYGYSMMVGGDKATVEYCARSLRRWPPRPTRAGAMSVPVARDTMPRWSTMASSMA